MSLLLQPRFQRFSALSVRLWVLSRAAGGILHGTHSSAPNSIASILTMKCHIKANLLNRTFVADPPLHMWYHWHSMLKLSPLIAVLLTHIAMAAVHWDQMSVKHTWNAVPANWESLGNTTVGTMIKLHIALKPNQENALIDALSDVSNPRHPRYVLLTTPPLAPLSTCPAPFQIWSISFKGTSC